MLQSGEVDERLERGAGLPHGVGRAIVGTEAVGTTADHGAHRAVRRERHECCFVRMQLAAFAGEARFHRPLGFRLQRQIERGFHHDGFADIADIARNVADHPVGEIARAGRSVGAHHLRWRSSGNLAGSLVDEAGIRHGAQHGGGAHVGGFGTGKRVEFRRRLHAPGKDRRFLEAELGCGLAEKALRRRFDAEGAGAEIHAVEIQREDLVFAVARLQIKREHRFLRLAVESAIGFEKQILRQLLRDGGAALHDMPRGHVLERRAHQADHIQPDVIAEAAVLDGDEGIRHVGGKIARGDHGALRQPFARDQAAVAIHDGDVVRRPFQQQIVGIGKLGNPVEQEHRADDEAPGADEREGVRPGALALRLLQCPRRVGSLGRMLGRGLHALAEMRFDLRRRHARQPFRKGFLSR